jgi:threonine aldolase
MSNGPIDLRSDTVTRPTPEMRAAIAEADVGDDVIDIDPTVEELQNRTAEILGKEAAIYMASGTMTNQVALRVHCSPGDEFICEANSHIYNYEQGAFAQLSGLVAQTVEGDVGVLQLDQLRPLIRPDNEHMVRTRLVCLENTHNRGAGRVQPYETVEQICSWAHEHGLRTHLDGARLFNAVAATEIPAERWAQHFDTVSVCFSKGLGAPVGSALAGSAESIAAARRHRKAFGGGMRQAGIIAAGALHALEHNRERLRDDHDNAQLIAQAVRDTEGLQLVPEQVDTNIVIFDVATELGSAHTFVTALQDRGVLMLAIAAQQVRAVTHLDVGRSQAEAAAEVIKHLGQQLARVH